LINEGSTLTFAEKAVNPTFERKRQNRSIRPDMSFIGQLLMAQMNHVP
jgi:hypothetical protein